jgi:hypothetical protein
MQLLGESTFTSGWYGDLTYPTFKLTLGLEMLEDKKLWDVRFLSWRAFADAVITRKGHIWSLLLNANLLIGGVNFTNDFLLVLTSLFACSRLDLIRFQ